MFIMKITMLISSILFIRYYYYFASHQPEVSYFSKIRIFDCLKIIIIFIHTADDDNFLYIIKINICCCYFCVYCSLHSSITITDNYMNFIFIFFTSHGRMFFPFLLSFVSYPCFSLINMIKKCRTQE